MFMYMYMYFLVAYRSMLGTSAIAPTTAPLLVEIEDKNVYNVNNVLYELIF